MIDPYIPERGNEGYRVDHYDLDLNYSVASNRLAGIARVTIVPVEPLARFALDLVGLRVVKVTVGGRRVRWRHAGGKIHLALTEPLEDGVEAVVEVRYTGSPHTTSSSCGPVGWEELEDGALVAAQPSGACTWFPCNDLAAQKASCTVTVTADAGYRVVGNGSLRWHGPTGSGETWTYEQQEPTSPYLVALHVGRYEERVLVESPTRVAIVATAAHQGAAERAFARLPAMMAAFVERFGPYPFAAGYRVIVCPEPLEIPVESQGQAAFGTNHLDGGHERFVAHELAHQWFGNSITAGSWRDVWLHEGFACYAEWLWSEASGGETADAHAREHHAVLRRLPQDLRIGDPGPEAMFDDRVYKRGALALHALRLDVGDVTFFELLQRWTSEHQHQVVDTAALLALASRVAGRSVASLMRPWLDELALPTLS